MATTKWRSSLANIETRLRRSLGIAGPIELDLAPALTPVVITDDTQRPGGSSLIRGRRWKAPMTMQVAAGNQGSVWLFCDGWGPRFGRDDPYAGGAVVDYIDMCPIVPTALGNIVQLGIWLFPTDLMIAPGAPVALTNNIVYFSDPLRSSTENAPLAVGFGNAVPGTGRLIWQGGFVAGGQARLLLPIDLFINFNSCVVVGNMGAAAAAIDMYVNMHGRIF